jgi:uncharacterized damage-inducible protein DinB
MANDYTQQLKASRDFFNRSTNVLTEADSGFKPKDGAWTVAQQVAHVAQTLEWFVQGASRPEGFDMDFEKLGKDVATVTSLTEARNWLERGYAAAIEFAEKQGVAGLAKPLPPGPIMGGRPIAETVWAMVEHTAHHRGALTVYSRLLGKVPEMPYGMG